MSVQRCVHQGAALLSLLLFPFTMRAYAQPATPTAVEAIAVGRGEVRVFWNPVPGAAQYTILRDGVENGAASSATNIFVDKTVEPGRTYRYEVVASDATGRSKPSRAYVERSYADLPAETRCDVLVVGATTAGVAAAVTASRYGLHVVMIEETRRLGGMPVNGLGATDLRRLVHSSGFFEEFRRKVASLYSTGDGLKYEPRVAHQAMKEIVWGEPRLTVHREVRPVKVIKEGSKISRVIAEEVSTGRRVTFLPTVIVDATECGDVAAWAGAPFRVGREPRSPREPHAGHLFYDREGDRPLPGSTGKGDRRVQAYAYLMTVQDYGPGADKTIAPPPGYDPRKYEHAVPWQKSWAVSSGRLPSGKFEVNQHPQGSDLQEVNYRYPTASYSERRRIEELYRNHALGYLYYVQTVEGKKNIGLSEDDYRDSGNWPPLLYIREARRFEAEQMLDESDIDKARDYVRGNAIGIGDYPMDSHAVQQKTDWSSPDMGEGEFYLPQYTPWHQVPYQVMIPQKVDNVFVPTAVSATHVAYGTVRLEPVRMHFGEAAGIAANLGVRYGLMPREVPANQIQLELVKRRTPDAGRVALNGMGAPGPSAHPALLYVYPDVKPDHRKYRPIHWLGARGFFPSPAPSQRGPVAGLVAQPFRPDEAIIVDEARKLLNLLRERAGVEPGWHPKARAEDLLIALPEARSVNRGLAARLLAGFMGWTAPAGAAHYADLTPGTPEQEAAEALYANWIDSRSWDDKIVYAPDGRLRFRAEEPVTRAQFAEMIYLAMVQLGPVWQDHPLDTTGP